METAAAAVTTAAVLAGVSKAAAAETARAALASVGIADVADRAAGTLSSGQRARLTLAVALAAPVALVCLDEPTAHLDSSGAEVVAAAVAALKARGSAVLVATHDPLAAAWPTEAHLHLDLGSVQAVPRQSATEARR